MKIAVVGSGGREHALIQKLAGSKRCSSIVAIPGNSAIGKSVPLADISAEDVPGVVAYCAQNGVDYVVVAPDNPLALGMVDALGAAGIPAFGPGRLAARIEASKVFSKNLMQKYGIPTAAYQTFDDVEKALSHLENSAYPVVIKADGLALGKGVLICETRRQAEEAVRQMMQEGCFGESGSRIVVEEFLQGPEVSVLAFCDGLTLVPMVSSMDHKRALDGDKGLNTGGMGAVAPNPFYTEEMAKTCMDTIFMPTVAAMEQEGCPFKGCLYFGLMLTAAGPKVIEYNCRFGDPETQVVLPLLESDLLEIMLACTEGRLTPNLVRFKKGSAACVVLASGGYPGPYEKGHVITGVQAAEQMPGVQLFFAGAAWQQSTGFTTAGGRVLGVTGTGETLEKALERAYAGAGAISFKDAHYRRDIGKLALSKLENGV